MTRILGVALVAWVWAAMVGGAGAFTLVEPGHWYTPGWSAHATAGVYDIAMDDSGVAFVSMGFLGEIHRYGLDRSRTLVANVGVLAPGIAWHNGWLYMGASDGSIYRLDPDDPAPTPERLGSIGGWILDLEMAPDTFGPYGGWIVAAGADGVAVFDPTSSETVWLVEGVRHDHLALTPGGAVWTTRSGGIYEIDATGNLTYKKAYGTTPVGLAIHPVTGEIFHGGGGGTSLVRRPLQGTGGTVATTNSGNVVRRALRFRPDGSSLMIGHQPTVGSGFALSTIDCFSADLPETDNRPLALGDIFVAVALPGAVYRVEDGTHCRAPFAWGLSSPHGLAVTPDYRLLVSEVGGRIRDITEGGDFSGTNAFAYGLDDPRNILVDRNGRILVSEATGVRDVTAGGSAAQLPLHAWDLSRPRGLMETFDGRIVVAEELSREVTDITAPGSHAETPPLFDDLPVPYAVAENAAGFWFAIGVHTGRIYRRYPGYSSWYRYGEVDGPDEIATDARDRLLAVEEYTGRILDVTLGGSSHPVVASGFGDFPQQIAVVKPPLPCRDGRDNDLDGNADWLDDDCSSEHPWAEASTPRCGLGIELALLTPLLARLRRRAAKIHSRSPTL